MKRKLSPNQSFVWIVKSITIVVLLLSSLYVAAQSGRALPKRTVKWTELSNNPNASFYEVQKDFYTKWKGQIKEMARAKRKHKEEKQESGGYEAFKRWEHFMAPRVYPSGDLTLPSTNFAKFMEWKKNTLTAPVQKSSINNLAIAHTGNWSSLGPIGSPAGPSPYSRTGAGRVNYVRFDPTNSNTMYVGAPDGGLWKSTNGGTSWTTNTDFLTIIGSSDLAIDPTNKNNMYLATGDLEADRLSIGVLKSTDGGTTWNTTGLVWDATNGNKISRLLMDPTNPLVMIISTNGGIYRTTNGWATYTQTQVGADLKSMEFNPGDHNILYAAGTTIMKSINNGVTWTPVTTGLPSSNVSRIALGVSAANPGYVYALIGKASDQSFLGMYRSTNSGTSFSLRASTPNVLGYAADGSDATAGQAFYDLSIAVSPTDAETVTTGGINHWQSSDGGTTWANKSLWDAGQIHADIHALNYLPGSSTTLFSCNDGGIFKSTDNGDNWTDLSHNLSIAQVVGIGLSANVATTIVDGEQDNGTNLKTGSTWNNIFGGDGGQCFIDYTSNSTIYIQYVQGDFERSDDGGASTTPIQTGLPAAGGGGGFDFYSSWHQDPVTSTKLYVAGTPTLYGSSNKGASWSALGTPPGSGTITEFAISPSNHAIIYAVKTDAVSKSINSGASFTDITGTLPSTAAFSNITVSNTDPKIVWVTYSGYSATDKVYKSIDGGATWTNISTGLPNLPVNTIVHVNGSTTDAVYIGADIGVYYFDNTLTSWVPYMTNLPNNAVKDLKIYYPTSKIRAATYGRGIWESDMYPVSSISDATLSNLAIKRVKNGNSTTAVLSPAFSSSTMGYSIGAPNSTASVTLTPTTNNSSATVKVNGTTVASGTASSSIKLNVGANTITTVVTAPDGTTTDTYTVAIDRRNVAGQSNAFDQPVNVNEVAALPTTEDGILVHSALSPNGDGVNDVFTIDGLNDYPDNKVTIINRDGVVIYQVQGYDNSSKVFDGHSSVNGVMQLPGTYFYSIEYQANGDTKRKSGYVVLKY